MSEAIPKPPADSEVVMTQLILPPDANALNHAFGGRVMGWIDVCAAIAAQRHCRRVVVTASMDELHFHAAVRVGFIVTLRARVLAAFKTSMEVGVQVTAEDPLTGARNVTTSALLSFVALGDDGRPVGIPPLLLETPAERLTYEEALARRQRRLENRADAQAWQRVLTR